MQIGSHWRLVLLLKISYLYWCSRPICNGLNLSTFSFPIARDLALRSLDKFITYSLLLDRESIPRELPKWGSRSSSNSNNIMRGCLYAITVVYCCRRSRKVSQGNINRDRGDSQCPKQEMANHTRLLLSELLRNSLWGANSSNDQINIVVVQFSPWFKFYFPLFQTHYYTLQYPKSKEHNI